MTLLKQKYLGEYLPTGIAEWLETAVPDYNWKKVVDLLVATYGIDPEVEAKQRRLERIWTHYIQWTRQIGRPTSIERYSRNFKIAFVTTSLKHKICQTSHSHRWSHSRPFCSTSRITERISNHKRSYRWYAVTRHSTRERSALSSPVVIVKKKDRSPRFYVDYRRLNNIMARDVYPLPRIDDVSHSLGSAPYSRRWLKASYWQIELDEDSKPKSVFIRRRGLFESVHMPFGLSTRLQRCSD